MNQRQHYFQEEQPIPWLVSDLAVAVMAVIGIIASIVVAL